MAFIPEDALWYIATLIEEITVEGEPQNIVHRNTHLIRADSSEEAYSKACELGRQGQMEYLNEQGQRVRITFHGLSDLDVIHDELEDGAELFYGEDTGLTRQQVKALVSAKENLNVFKEITPSNGPDYTAADILAEARELLIKRPPSK